MKKGPASANTNSGAERGRRRLDRGCDHGESGQEKRPSELRGGAKPVGGLANDAEHMRKGGGKAAVVLDAEGKVAGILTNDNIAEMMMVENARPGWRFTRR